ncbi:hypothetical protein [Deinococcus hopiensis]|uniref:Uncharacterized protein n=1 Tax=Deinococcus hopiensis KR-140 TaxID=695939 RepID=A0A1W1UYL6_9DEIO|nr:hypothetical protein [Deinococcus hopiensis]SMB86197.1 hypothetical protein SAMN00790413_03725 [Deinococcus hopiensis KR-140]
MNTRNIIGLVLVTAALVSCRGTTPGSTNGDQDFTLTAQPSELGIGASHVGTTSIRITRPGNATGAVKLTFEGAVAGTGADHISGAFGPQTGGTSVLTVTVGAHVSAGTYPVTVRGTNGALTKTTGMQVKVEKWLLVDADRSANNAAPQDNSKPLSTLDTTMRAALVGKAFDVFVVKAGRIATDVPAINGPNADTLSKYSGVVWYTGNQWDQPPTRDDVNAMTSYLAGTDHKLIVQSAAFVQNLDGTGNVFQETDQNTDKNTAQKAFLRDQFGIAGYTFQYRRDGPSVQPVDGTVTQGMGALQLTNPASTAAFKRREDADGHPLLTVEVNQNVRGAVALEKTGLGNKGSSAAVYLGFSPDEVGTGDSAGLLSRLLRE